LYFPSAVSTTHDEWTIRQILVHLGLFSGTTRLNEETAKFHARQNIFLTAAEITTFQGRTPDGVAFDAKGKQCVFLEFTCPMDSVLSSDEGDWAEGKELEKSERYGLHRYCINNLSALSGRPWNCSQINFIVGVRGSLKKIQFQERLHLLGVTNSKTKDKIRALTVSKTLPCLTLSSSLSTSLSFAALNGL